MTQAEVTAKLNGTPPLAMTARERNQARANGTLIDPHRPGQAPPVPDVQCLHRSWSPVGKIRCNCSNQPEVYGCAYEAIRSGYATPRMPQQPGDGPIVLFDGTKLTPKDDRYPNFLAMPLREGERPRPCDVVVCSSCPWQTDPPQHIARLKALGVVGDHDPETGHCDVLHVMPMTSPKPDRIAVPGGRRECVVTVGRDKPLQDLVDVTGCGLLIVYATAASLQVVKPLASANPALKLWLVAQDGRQKQEVIQNVWYDLPLDLADDLAARTKAAYETAVARILE
jgi:hypothetical protein